MSILVLRNYAIILLYVVLFGTAAFDKWKSRTTPDWIIQQFAKTWIAKLPGGAKFGYWMIASLEGILALVFVLSAFQFLLLPYALVGSLFLFGLLLLGLRVTFDFQGSANMFTYFGVTLLCLFLVSMS